MSESEIDKKEISREMGVILWNNYFVGIEINEKMIRQQVKALTNKYHIIPKDFKYLVIKKTDDPSKWIDAISDGCITMPSVIMKWREQKQEPQGGTNT